MMEKNTVLEKFKKHWEKTDFPHDHMRCTPDSLPNESGENYNKTTHLKLPEMVLRTNSK